MKQKLNDTLNNSISDIMQKEKLNTAMLAYFADIPSTTLYGWTGEGRTPSLSTLCQVAKALRVTLNDLVPPEVYGGEA